MRNCLVMGFGRSGTSLMGGILHQAGYFMGDDLYPPRNTNPRGFFENAFINGINERIMTGYDFDRSGVEYPRFENPYSPYKPGYGHRWLSYIPPEVMIDRAESKVMEDIQLAVTRKNFAYKDPRFNYTLQVWKPFLGDRDVCICMFRAPEITIRSVMEECRNADYLSNFSITPALAGEVWRNSYNHLLKNKAMFDAGRFLFVHYSQLLTGAVLPFLSDQLGVSLSGSFIDKNLDRTKNSATVDGETTKLYHELCRLAGYNPEQA